MGKLMGEVIKKAEVDMLTWADEDASAAAGQGWALVLDGDYPRAIMPFVDDPTKRFLSGGSNSATVFVVMSYFLGDPLATKALGILAATGRAKLVADELASVLKERKA